MIYPWTENRKKKQEEKTIRYGPLRWEIKQQFPGYDIRQYNIIVDVLGGQSTEVDEAMRELFVARGGKILLRMQRAVISHTLNIARTLQVISCGQNRVNLDIFSLFIANQMLCIYFTSYRVVNLRAAWVTFDAPGWLDRDPYGIHTSSLS